MSAEPTPRFSVGQRVRIRDERPGVHHRVPAYAKGQVGVIERVCGLFGRPEAFIRGDGRPATRLYRVRLPLSALWPPHPGGSGEATGRPEDDKLEIEIFEHWLQEAP